MAASASRATGHPSTGNGQPDSKHPPPLAPPAAPSRTRTRWSYPGLTQHDLMRIALEGQFSDVRTIVKYLAGCSQSANTRMRIERALRACGFERFVRAC